MNVIGIIVIILALIGGVVGGSYFHEQKNEKEEKKKNEKFVDKQFFYSSLDKPLIVPIFEEGKAAAMLIAEISLELKTADTSSVANKKPRLRDEFLQVFSYYSAEGKLGEDMLSPRIQAELRRDLTRVGKKLIGEEILNAVLISNLQRQDL